MFGDGMLGFLSDKTRPTAVNLAGFYLQNEHRFQLPWVYKVDTGRVPDPRRQTVARAGYWGEYGAPNALHARRSRNSIEKKIWDAAQDGSELGI